MLDFMTIATKVKEKEMCTEVFPKFIMKKSKDLMIRGRDFYAIWDDEQKLWSTDEDDVTRLVDQEMERWVEDHNDHILGKPVIKHMWDADSGMIDKFHKYCQKQMRDNYHELDEELIFANSELTRESYASKKLDYPLVEGSIDAWNKVIGTLYDEEERHKIEWVIGAIVSGDSRYIQKFMVLYGAAGTGKSTILNVIQQLFDGYYCSFDAKALGQANNAFALEPFKSSPLVAIQHDGDLSRIEDNTRLNSLVSHETMPINEKFKGIYETHFKCFLFVGTNRPVKITDGKSGLLRRLIDVTPSGRKLGVREYRRLIKQIPFELGAIAYHCLQVYKDDTEYYDDYIPKNMLSASNDFYNFVCDSYSVFKKQDGTTLKAAWEMYKQYVEEAKVFTPFSKRIFKEELKNYFWDYEDRIDQEDGTKLINYYSGFRTSIFDADMGRSPKEKEEEQVHLIDFKEQASLFDSMCSDCTAQYATTEDSEKPLQKWENVTTKLSDLDTSKVHYVRVPENHIVIDFDIKDENGNKCFEKNLQEASKWPPTYAEISKGGNGIHLHYIYAGDDVTKLSRIYTDDVEVKVFTGNSSLRRRLSKCNDLPVATISSGLPLKGVKKVRNFDCIKNEQHLRAILKRHINKEIMCNTKPSIDMIYKTLEEAYESGMGYDVSDMKNAIYALALDSSNQSDTCLKLVAAMHFKSENASEVSNDSNNEDLVFYDIEVFPNLFLVCYKFQGLGKPVVRLINPRPSDIEELIKFKLVGFNNRQYDNHMIYACLMGYTVPQLYDLSQRLVNKKDKQISRKAKFGEAYNLSYTDIYDFASAGNKKSLKKLEIEMSQQSETKLRKKGFSDDEIAVIKAGTHHQELGLPWNEPVPKEKWGLVADYCGNDLVATEASFCYLKGDWIAREILADITGMTVNDSTNSLSQRIIFGNDRNPQTQFNYRNLALPVGSDQYEEYLEKFGHDYRFRVFDADGMPQYRDYVPYEVLPDGWSILPFFPGYEYKNGKSTYLGEEIGEGGRVYSEPGFYGAVWDGDVTGQHPSSIIAEVLFGPEYTKAFKDIVDGRVSIKHEAWNVIDRLFDGKLKPYIQKVIDGELTTKMLANALKTVVNSVYGQTKASYKCAFRDDRNIDNIVAKRGALFMTLLKREVQKRGFTVAHIKTDSIKIPDATPEIQQFVLDFGKEYGYSFETEAEFEKFCLVNKAVYIAKTTDGEWTATGDQFAVPYVFKTLFSHEPIVFDDLCDTFSASKGALYLDMNESLPDVKGYEHDLDKLKSKYKQGKISDVMYESMASELNKKIEEGHSYQFIGRVGHFCPIKPGHGGGEMYRVDEGKRAAASGTTGYRWLESETIRGVNEEFIDTSYFTKLVDDAVDTINKYVDFEWFVSDDPYIPKKKEPAFMNIPEGSPEEVPFDEDVDELPFY